MFLTFNVIAGTLVGSGLGLEPVIRALRIPPNADRQDELRAALGDVAEAGLERLAQLEAEGGVGAADALLFRTELEMRHRRYRTNDREAADRVAGATARARAQIVAAHAGGC